MGAPTTEEWIMRSQSHSSRFLGLHFDLTNDTECLRRIPNASLRPKLQVR